MLPAAAPAASGLAEPCATCGRALDTPFCPQCGERRAIRQRFYLPRTRADGDMHRGKTVVEELAAPAIAGANRRFDGKRMGNLSDSACREADSESRKQKKRASKQAKHQMSLGVTYR